MGVQVSMEIHLGVPVLVLSGMVEDRLLPLIADGIESVASDSGGIVINLDHLVLTDVPAVKAFLARVCSGAAADCVAFACRRLSCRRLLRRLGGDELHLFATAADAVSHLQLAASCDPVWAPLA